METQLLAFAGRISLSRSAPKTMSPGEIFRARFRSAIIARYEIDVQQVGHLGAGLHHPSLQVNPGLRARVRPNDGRLPFLHDDGDQIRRPAELNRDIGNRRPNARRFDESAPDPAKTCGSRRCRNKANTSSRVIWLFPRT